jgi:dTDP-4-amino-4,6-dideoxygalactose transaminase
MSETEEIIPYNKPFIVGEELFNIARAVIENNNLSGDGPFTRQCQKWFEDNLHCRKSLLTHSCTAALEMAALLCEIGPGDEVIMPSFTFVSTANAFVLRGGVPVFVDIRPDTLNINAALIEGAITPRTKAIVPVHYAGSPCAMDDIMAIASQHNLFVIEDAAQALLATYNGQFLGTIGHFGTFSFHETKNIISGEGGALFINDEQFIERAEVIWEKGTNRKKFFRGEIDKYTWVDIGSSFTPSELIAAFLHAQLMQAEKIIQARCKLINLYREHLEPLASTGRIRLPVFNLEGSFNGHIFYIITSSLAERTALISYLSSQSIYAIFHYIPLHSSPGGKNYGRAHGNMDNTDELSDRILRLPLYYEMTEEQLRRVVVSIQDFYEQK